MKILAVICVRNEELYIARCLQHWINNGCEVVLIDNDSEDRTTTIARAFLGQGLLAIERLPWKGRFSVKDQLLRKKKIIEECDHDWVVHADADEILRSPWAGITLRSAMDRLDGQDFNCVNFREIVFVPWAHEDFRRCDYVSDMKTYYFFEPSYPRLVRAWRRAVAASNVDSGGHLLQGVALKIYPHDFILSHYIVLSFEHACEKYVGRQFDQGELAMGWHYNRVGIRPEHLALKPSPFLKQLGKRGAATFDLTVPTAKHFWEW